MPGPKGSSAGDRAVGLDPHDLAAEVVGVLRAIGIVRLPQRGEQGAVGGEREVSAVVVARGGIEAVQERFGPPTPVRRQRAPVRCGSRRRCRRTGRDTPRGRRSKSGPIAMPSRPRSASPATGSVDERGRSQLPVLHDPDLAGLLLGEEQPAVRARTPGWWGRPVLRQGLGVRSRGGVGGNEARSCYHEGGERPSRGRRHHRRAYEPDGKMDQGTRTEERTMLSIDHTVLAVARPGRGGRSGSTPTTGSRRCPAASTPRGAPPTASSRSVRRTSS